jgi:hypothetical protein
VADLPGPRAALDDDGLMTVACREFVELVTEHLEGLLPEPVERAIAAHLELCEPCLIYLEQIRATTRLLRGLPTPSLTPPARNRLLEVFSALHGGPDAHPRG